MPENKVNKIHYTSHYLKTYQKLPKEIQKLQDKKEQWFQESYFDARLKTHKLKGKFNNFYSYSIAHKWRVLFRFIKKSEVIFYDIGTHKIYK